MPLKSEQHEKVKQLLNEGMSMRQISNETGISTRTLYKHYNNYKPDRLKEVKQAAQEIVQKTIKDPVKMLNEYQRGHAAIQNIRVLKNLSEQIVSVGGLVMDKLEQLLRADEIPPSDIARLSAIYVDFFKALNVARINKGEKVGGGKG